MNSQWEFIVKVIVLSAILSLLVKYGGRKLPVTPTPAIALVAVLVLPLAMMFWLLWQTQQQSRS